jgi:CheY-like chemotaxis protein
VHVISSDRLDVRGLRLGAFGYSEKPTSKEHLLEALANIKAFAARNVKTLLVVEDDDAERQSIVDLIGNGDVKTTAVATGAQALAELKANRFDCMVLDLGLPDISGFDLLEQIKADLRLTDLPTIVYTAREITPEQEIRLMKLAETIIVKDVRSRERLLEETTLFLHRIEANLPESTRGMLRQLYQRDPVLAGKRILVVDDDVRNIFALTSVLEGHGVDVTYATTGRDALAQLASGTPVDAVLMDIMMPEMDGYETMRAARKDPRLKALPIIALTAKAMKGDREKCIEAGASDYAPKPVDTEQLLSLLRVWLYR